MALGDVLCKEPEKNLFWIRFPLPGQNPFHTSIFKHDETDNWIDISWLNLEYYSGWERNEHHIMTKYYHNVIMPFLSYRIPNFPFKLTDFNLVRKFVGEEQYDVSYLVPKDESLRFTLEVNKVEIGRNLPFDILHRMDDERVLYDGDTYFHRQYNGAHACSILINNTIDNDRRIMVTGDSMMIPIIPVLGCYFKEVVYMDNRDGESYKEYYENKVFDNIIIEVWEGFKIAKPLIENLQ